MNLEIARFGLKKMLPSKETFSYHENVSLGYKIRNYCFAASAARMSGVPLPVMSSSGSGNQGIVATLPVALTGEYFQKSRKDIAKAAALSHLFLWLHKEQARQSCPRSVDALQPPERSRCRNYLSSWRSKGDNRTGNADYTIEHDRHHVRWCKRELFIEGGPWRPGSI